MLHLVREEVIDADAVAADEQGAVRREGLCKSLEPGEWTAAARALDLDGNETAPGPSVTEPR